MTIKRVGFCCKLIDHRDQVNGIKATDDCKKYNTGTTTIAWLNRQTRTAAVDKLWSITKQNINSIKLLVEKVASYDEALRMVRLSSDILPAYTEPSWAWFYQQADVRNYCEQQFSKIGDFARQNNVRLSMHPGQFTVLASDNERIVNSSIEEFEYHVDIARWMGYGNTFQDFKINVHVSGRQGPDGIKAVMPRLSTEARNTLTIENDEMTWGLDASLELVDTCALVLDIHHHWVKTGEYIDVTDDRIKRVIDSWRGVRPVIHYSVSREDCLVDHCRNTRPDLNPLLESGYKKQKLRAHSDFFWNHAVNEWAVSHNEWADIMCEAKGKNIASGALYDTYIKKG